MKHVLAILLLVSMAVSSSFVHFSMAEPTTVAPPTPSFCDLKCGVRCANAGVKDRCLTYCGICCRQCNCVPSGTYGNKSECPCYRDKLNSKGTAKCP